MNAPAAHPSAHSTHPYLGTNCIEHRIAVAATVAALKAAVAAEGSFGVAAGAVRLIYMGKVKLIPAWLRVSRLNR